MLLNFKSHLTVNRIIIFQALFISICINLMVKRHAPNIVIIILSLLGKAFNTIVDG